MVRGIGLSKSLPTPNTQEFARVVVNFAVGAPVLALPDPTAPIAPEPFAPDVSIPEKLTMVSDEAAEGQDGKPQQVAWYYRVYRRGFGRWFRRW